MKKQQHFDILRQEFVTKYFYDNGEEYHGYDCLSEPLNVVPAEYGLIKPQPKQNVNEIVIQATTNRDLLEIGAHHISTLFQNKKNFLPDEQQQFMDMLLTLNTMVIRQDKIIKKTLKIGDDYL